MKPSVQVYQMIEIFRREYHDECEKNKRRYPLRTNNYRKNQLIIDRLFHHKVTEVLKIYGSIL